MELKVFSIFDSKSSCYKQPFFARATGEGVRIFEDIANMTNENNQVNLHPEDFILYEIGIYDDSTGNIEPVQHVTLGKAIEFIK